MNFQNAKASKEIIDFNQEIKNFTTIEPKFTISFSAYTMIKFYLRGITSLSYVHPLAAKLQQAKMQERVAVEINDPQIGSYIVVAVRKSLEKGVVITGWKVNCRNQNILEKARELMDILYKIVFDRKLSSWDIKKEKEWLFS